MNQYRQTNIAIVNIERVVTNELNFEKMISKFADTKTKKMFFLKLMNFSYYIYHRSYCNVTKLHMYNI